MRGFSTKKTDVADDLRDVYRVALQRHGLQWNCQGTPKKKYKRLKTFAYQPPEAFLMWHTNQYKNNQVEYRIYIIAVSQ